MNTLDHLERGLFLPNRGVWIDWGATYDDLAGGADDAKSWKVENNGHSESYAEVRWEHERLVPLKPEDSSWSGSLDGLVIARLQGKPPKIKWFELYVFDKGYYRFEIFQYSLWMSRLASKFGEPKIPTSGLHEGCLHVPKCIWEVGSVAIDLALIDGKGTPCLRVLVQRGDF